MYITQNLATIKQQSRVSDSKHLHSPGLQCATALQCRATSDLIHAFQEMRLPLALSLFLLQACSPASPPQSIKIMQSRQHKDQKCRRYFTIYWVWIKRNWLWWIATLQDDFWLLSQLEQNRWHFILLCHDYHDECNKIETLPLWPETNDMKRTIPGNNWT